MSAKEQFSRILSAFLEDDECCLICDKSLTSILDLLGWKPDIICPQCRNALKGKIRHQQVSILEVSFQVTYCYMYSKDLGDYFYRYKTVGDIRLAEMFLTPFKKQLKKGIRNRFDDCVLLRMPSWKEDDRIRGYNHVDEIFSYMRMPIYSPFMKRNNAKQSNKTKSQRKQTKDLIVLDPDFDQGLLQNKQIIFVDDVMTTGNTLYRAATLLGLSSVPVIVVALHEFLSKKDDEK